GAPSHWPDGVVYDQEQATYTTYWLMSIGDFDGDGRADLVAYYGNADGLETYVALATVGGNFTDLTYTSLPGFAGATVIVADVNGDGRMDLVGSSQNVLGWQLMAATSTGNGTFGMPNGGSFLPFNSLGWFVIAGDFNGDGRMDFAAYRGLGTTLQLQ